MAPYHFWIQRSNQDPTIPLTLQSTENQHTDQYLHWDSNHFITAKNSVYNTLAHRAKVVSSTAEDLNKEMEHLKKALKDCHFTQLGIK